MKRLKCMYGSIIFLACTVRRLKVMFTCNYSRNNFETLSEGTATFRLTCHRSLMITPSLKRGGGGRLCNHRLCDSGASKVGIAIEALATLQCSGSHLHF